MGLKPRVGAASIHVALLRGINVGGHRKVPMAELRLLLADLGYDDVETYIQSGNAVFRAPMSNRHQAALVPRIEDAIEARFGFRTEVIVRTASDVERICASNPFLPGTDPKTLHVGFLATEPQMVSVDPELVAPDEVRLIGRELFLRTPNGMSRTKLTTRLLAKFGPCTVRNWRTVGRLAAMVTSTSSAGKG